MNYHYTVIIQWSDSAQCFVVTLPEWGDFCHTYGENYEEAIKNAQEVIDFLVKSALEEGQPLPRAKTFEEPVKGVKSELPASSKPENLQ